MLGHRPSAATGPKVPAGGPVRPDRPATRRGERSGPPAILVGTFRAVTPETGRPGPADLDRRTFMVGAGVAGASLGLLPLLRRLPPARAAALLAGPPGGPHFLTPHERGVVIEATARLVPGPRDDPAETAPGAREAGAVDYVDGLLAVFDDHHAMVFAGGPWSDRNVGGRGKATPNPMAEPVPLRPWEVKLWRGRIADLRKRYRTGIAELDAAAGGDFTAVDASRRDRILAADTPSRFRRLLFEHTVEAMYAVPEYGGNHDGRGWESIGFRGDTAPTGWPAEEVRASDGPDPVPEGFRLPFPGALADGGGGARP